MLSALLDAAEAGLVAGNPAERAKPLTAREANSRRCSAGRPPSSGFLDWSREHSENARGLARPGPRRHAAGRLLALLRRDVDLDGATISIRRLVGIVRTFGEGAETVEGATKTDKARVVDLDMQTVALLRSWKRDCSSAALSLARDDALVFGDLKGYHRHPERFSRLWNQTVTRAIREGAEHVLIGNQREAATQFALVGRRERCDVAN